jgi:hypothetical protein
MAQNRSRRWAARLCVRRPATSRPAAAPRRNGAGEVAGGRGEAGEVGDGVTVLTLGLDGAEGRRVGVGVDDPRRRRSVLAAEGATASGGGRGEAGKLRRGVATTFPATAKAERLRRRGSTGARASAARQWWRRPRVLVVARVGGGAELKWGGEVVCTSDSAGAGPHGSGGAARRRLRLGLHRESGAATGRR